MRIRIAVTALALVAGSMALATPAQATDKASTICGAWKAEGATGKYPDVKFGDKPEGTVITQSTAKLVKPTTGEDPGVQFARLGADIKTEGTTKVTVAYELSEDADFVNGAVRLFGYKSKTPNTLNDAPSWQDTATSDAGMLSFTVTDGDTIGSLGLVYDASNSAKGSVTFSSLMVGDAKVSFLACPEPQPSESATTKPTVTPKPTTTSEDPEPTAPAPTPGAGDPTLPVTGPGIGAIFGFAVFLIALGVVSVYGARRKRRFTA